jgi:hypothetical protein
VVTLKSWSLKESAELVGITTIVASLIFVGMELRQAQEIAIASQYQTRTQFNLDYISTLDDQSAAGQGKLLRDAVLKTKLTDDQTAYFSELSDEEFGKIASNARRIIFIFDNSHFQYQAGFMNEESWQAIRRRTKNVLGRNVVARAEILEQPDRWRDSLVREFETMMIEYDSEPQ